MRHAPSHAPWIVTLGFFGLEFVRHGFFGLGFVRHFVPNMTSANCYCYDSYKQIPNKCIVHVLCRYCCTCR